MCFSEIFFKRSNTNKNTVLIKNKQIIYNNVEIDDEQKHDDVTHEQLNREDEEMKDIKETEDDNYVREELSDFFSKKKN